MTRDEEKDDPCRSVLIARGNLSQMPPRRLTERTSRASFLWKLHQTVFAYWPTVCALTTNYSFSQDNWYDETGKLRHLEKIQYTKRMSGLMESEDQTLGTVCMCEFCLNKNWGPQVRRETTFEDICMYFTVILFAVRN